MDLILIACCAKKRVGGEPGYTASEVQKNLPAETFARLLAARRVLAKAYQYPNGLDFGEPEPQQPIAYLPAYRRYIGRVYQHGEFERLFPTTRNKKVAILSAFYGIIDASDLLRDYNLVMESLVKVGIRYQPYDYPGKGMASLWHRGDDHKKLLRGS